MMTGHRLPSSDVLRVMASLLALLFISVPFTVGSGQVFPVTIAPFVTKVQMVTANIALGSFNSIGLL
jgi:hypothetical protein